MYEKINIFKDGCYICSTNMHKTCKSAKNSMLRYGYSSLKGITAHFTKAKKYS